jgi:DNA-binding MarR family transcriptional regulator
LVAPVEITKKARTAGGIPQGQPDEVDVWRAIVDNWKRVQRSVEKSLVALDLTGAELRILRVITEQGSSPLNRFCHETMLSAPSITGIVDKLEERGLVERVRSVEDRREVLIAITVKGKQTYAKAMDSYSRFIESVLSVLKPDEVESLVSLIKELADASEDVAKASEFPGV